MGIFHTNTPIAKCLRLRVFSQACVPLGTLRTADEQHADNEYAIQEARKNREFARKEQERAAELRHARELRELEAPIQAPALSHAPGAIICLRLYVCHRLRHAVSQHIWRNL